ncbi:MAG: NAD-dependent epimerase/dehydratase family protein [Phycisphaerales bacterium]|nr:NAD-dependent epimerase/dehydratase family protein [Phycisphaerales bacterium]MCB9835236.1 NAD-dependent epimerase/dehydratase family protein [Phycisphaera sp.]
MRVLVTGATGFTGGRLAEMLIEQGDEVVALARKSARTEKLTAAGASIVTGDIRSKDDVRRAAEGCEVIYHIAALYRSAKHPDSVYHDVNVCGTENVLSAARKFGVSRVVHCSTIGVHGRVKQRPVDETAPFAPGDIYQRTKLKGEMLAKAAAEEGMPVSIVRPAGIYGPGDLRFLKLFRMIHTGRFRMIGSGSVVYHFTYVDDLCRGFMACATNPNAINQQYVICGRKYHPISEVARIVSDCVGTPLRKGSVPVGPVMTAARLCEMVCKPFGIEPPLHRRRLDFFIKDRAFTGAKAKEQLGFEAQVPLRTGFERTARWYFKQGLLDGAAPETLLHSAHATSNA